MTIIFLNIAPLNSMQNVMQKAPDTPIQTAPMLDRGHSITCYEYPGEMRITHTYLANQPHWGFNEQTNQFFCFHDPNNPLARIEIPRNKTAINITLYRNNRRIFSGGPFEYFEIRHNPETRTYTLRFFRVPQQFQQLVAQQ